jgi:hypothetical protein
VPDFSREGSTGRDLDAGSNQIDHDDDEGTDEDEFKDFTRILAAEEGSYGMKYTH